MRADGNGDNDTKTHATIANGTRIGRYKIIERIGAGGMGEVYLADDTDLGRRVALKFLSLDAISDDESRSRFRREAQAAAVLSHPNIVTIHEVGEHKSRPFIVMEYVKGRSLRDIIGKGGLPLQAVIKLAIGICKGLARAHEAKVIHRDIKPSNIVIDSDGEPKLLDFGLAILQGGEEITKAGWAVGTIGYMSPEQIEGEKADHRSDIFSLGVVLYQMLTGQHPFSKGSQGATFQAILNEYPQPVSQLRSDIPGDLQPIIDRALEKDREKRYQRVDDLLNDLRELGSRSQSDVSGVSAISGFGTPSIAVMAFSNLSADPEQEYFCDGISEEIINTLAHVEGLRVVARTSSFAFKGKNEDIREIGQRLNVESLLEGSVRKAGGRLRITAQLVNVSDGYHLWSERFDRDAEDIFKIQDEISEVIVDKLKVKLFGEDKVKIVKRPMADMAAYELYLKGRYFWSQRTEESFQKAIDCFLKVLERDPSNALAHAGIADCYNMFGFLDFLPPIEAFPRARTAARKALEIDDGLAEAHTSLAHVMQYHDWNWEEAEKEYRRAIELNPNYVTAHQWYAEVHACRGRFDEAVAESRASVKLDPLSPIVNTNYAGILMLARRYDEAIEHYQETLEVNQDFAYARYFLSWSYTLRSEFESALSEIDKAIELAGGGTPVMLALRGHILARSGAKDQAEVVLRDILHMSTTAYVSADNVALIYSSLGQLDEAFAWMERAYQERNHWLVFLKVAPQYDEFRNDPRFIRLLSKMNLD